MLDELTNISYIDDILNVLSPNSRESLYILSVPNLLNDFLAEKILHSTGKANGNSHQLIEELRSYPIWHERTIKTWVFDDDIREYALEKLNGSGNEIRQKILTIMKEYRDELEHFPELDINDFDLQMARLSIGLEESRKDGIQKFRQIFYTAYKYKQSETERVVDLYISERFPECIYSEERISSELSSIYLMRGLYAYRNGKFDKAIHFLLPIWKNMNGSRESMKDAAISTFTLGRIWSTDQSQWKEAEEAFQQSLELGRDDLKHTARVYHILGILLSKDQSRWKEAEEAYKQSLKLLKDNLTHKAFVYNSLGNLLSNDQSRWKEADEAFNLSLKFGKDNSEHTTKVYYNLGNLLKKIELHWEKSGKIQKKEIGEIYGPLSQAFIFYRLGNQLSKNQFKCKETEEVYKKSLELGKNNTFHVAKVYHSLGNLLSKDQSRWKEAEEFYEHSLEFGKDNTTHKAFVYHSFGNLLSKNQLRWKEAEEFYKQSLELGKDNSTHKAFVYHSFGKLLSNNQSRWKEAEEYYKLSLELGKDNPYHVAKVYQSLGNLNINMNRVVEGINYYNIVLKRKELLPDYGAMCFANLAKEYEELQNSKDAVRNYFFASANYFLLFKHGVNCLDDVLKYLVKVAELGDEKTKGDAEIIIITLNRLAGKEVIIPEVPLSRRGEALKEALNGNRVKIKPENEIDLMVISLIKDLMTPTSN